MFSRRKSSNAAREVHASRVKNRSGCLTLCTNSKPRNSGDFRKSRAQTPSGAYASTNAASQPERTSNSHISTYKLGSDGCGNANGSVIRVHLQILCPQLGSDMLDEPKIQLAHLAAVRIAERSIERRRLCAEKPMRQDRLKLPGTQSCFF